MDYTEFLGVIVCVIIYNLGFLHHAEFNLFTCTIHPFCQSSDLLSWKVSRPQSTK